MSDDYVPRFTFEISEEQKARADRVLATYGLRKAVFSTILDDLLDLIEERGNIVVGILLGEVVKPREILPSMNEAERKSK